MEKEREEMVKKQLRGAYDFNLGNMVCAVESGNFEGGIIHYGNAQAFAISLGHVEGKERKDLLEDLDKASGILWVLVKGQKQELRKLRDDLIAESVNGWSNDPTYRTFLEVTSADNKKSWEEETSTTLDGIDMDALVEDDHERVAIDEMERKLREHFKAKTEDIATVSKYSRTIMAFSFAKINFVEIAVHLVHEEIERRNK